MTFEERLHLVNEKKLNITAVDIGNEGGLCSNDFSGDVCLRRMPGTHRDQWEAFLYGCPHVVVAENVHAMPGQGLVSTGTLLRNRGRLEGFCAALDIEPHFIEPLAWQQCFTLKRRKHFPDKRQFKKHLMEVAKSLAPPSLVNEITLQTADAFLIWNYAASQQTEEPLKPIAIRL